jgi:DNA-binding NtrC family response regulator
MVIALDLAGGRGLLILRRQDEGPWSECNMPTARHCAFRSRRRAVVTGEALIREAGRLRPLLPVILVSGYVGDAAAAAIGWADEVLAKPLRAHVLAASLARVLEKACAVPDANPGSCHARPLRGSSP